MVVLCVRQLGINTPNALEQQHLYTVVRTLIQTAKGVTQVLREYRCTFSAQQLPPVLLTGHKIAETGG